MSASDVLNPRIHSMLRSWSDTELQRFVREEDALRADLRVREILQRTAALYRFASLHCDECTGVYVGKTINPKRRFNQHRAQKPRADEAVIMIVLQTYESEETALIMEKLLTDALWCAKVPRYDREEPFGGKGLISGADTACVYALVVVRGFHDEPKQCTDVKSPFPMVAPGVFSGSDVTKLFARHKAAPVGSFAARPTARTPHSYVNKRGRPSWRTTEDSSFRDKIARMMLKSSVSHVDAMWGAWPNDGTFGVINVVDGANPIPAMAERVVALDAYAKFMFKRMCGTYVGKTTTVRARFDDHRRRKLRDDETLIMVLLHEFPDEDEAFLAERRLTDVLMAMGVKQYDREQQFGGKGGHARTALSAFVYAMVVVGEPKTCLPG